MPKCFVNHLREDMPTMSPGEIEPQAKFLCEPTAAGHAAREIEPRAKLLCDATAGGETRGELIEKFHAIGGPSPNTLLQQEGLQLAETSPRILS